MEIFIVTVIFVIALLSSTCKADTDKIVGSVCSVSDNSTLVNQYQTNLNNLLNSLAANGATNDGFYMNSKGKDGNTIYGLAQCRGDINPTNCSSCIKNATKAPGCPSSTNVTIWLTWCFIRYSNMSFFGMWDQSGYASMNDTDFDDLDVVSHGLNFMTVLASTTPTQPLMFQVSVLDVGSYGKRYGMAQCTRDITRTDCANCLYYQLMTFRTIVGNKRNWETYGSSCSMWYHDYQFFFNFTVPTNEGFPGFSKHWLTFSTIVLVAVSLLAVM